MAQLTAEVNAQEFFHERVSNFEEERRLFSDYLSLIVANKSDRHDLEWRNRKLEDDDSTAKLLCSNLDAELASVQLDISKVRSEIQDAKNNSETRKQQIARLQTLCQPVQHDTTYLIGEKFNTKPKQIRTQKDYDPLRNNNPYKLPRSQEVLKLEGLLQMETVRATSYLQELQSTVLNAEGDRQRFVGSGLTDITEQYNEARTLLEEEDKYGIQCFLAVTELLRLRLRIMIAQREEVEELSRLQADRKFYAAKEERTSEQLANDLSNMKRRMKAELEETNQDFQRQLLKLDGEIKTMRDEEVALGEANTRIHDKEVKLTAELAEWRGRYEKLRRRNALEMEGYEAEAHQLRGRLQHLQSLYAIQQRDDSRIAQRRVARQNESDLSMSSQYSFSKERSF